MSKLKRALGLTEITAYGVGIILGAGIYALIGKAAGMAGNALWIAFIVGSILSSITALSYIEMSCIYPKAAAEFEYFKQAFGKSLITFLIGFLPIASGVIASSAVALGFGGYLESLTGLPMVWGAVLLILACGLVNLWGIKEAARFNIIFTIIEISGLLLIIFFGIILTTNGSIEVSSIDYFEMPNGFSGVMSAAALIFFAYIGFEDIVNMAEEVKNPIKVMPKAFLYAITIASFLFILVSLSAITIVPWDTLALSDAPLADVAEAAFPGSSLILGIIALFATANTVLIILIVETRMVWGMADAKSLPKIFTTLHPKRKTPWVAIIAVTVISILFISAAAITDIAQVTDIIIFLIFISVNVSLIALRYKKPDLPRPFKVPISIGKFPILPLLGIIIPLYLMFHLESIVFFYLAFILIVGIIIYFTKDRITD